jgi:uncharacterized protein DUF2334
LILAIRDDDINYFTRPRDLEEIYRPLFESGLPLNLAVIPRVDSREQEPYVDESERGQANLHDVGENSDLVDFIRRMDDIEVAQHGLSHTGHGPGGAFVPEFSIHNRGELQRKAAEGKKILDHNFGEAPRFFVPPWDRMSREAYDVIRKHFPGCSTSSSGRSSKSALGPKANLVPKSVPADFLVPFIRGRLSGRGYYFVGSFLLLEHDMNYFGGEAFSHSPHSPGKTVVTIVNHYWWLNANRPRLDSWHRFLQTILSDKNVRVASFSQVRKELAKDSPLPTAEGFLRAKGAS